MSKQVINLKSGKCTATIRASRDTMDIIGGKWKVAIISCLCYSPQRFSELLKEVEGISSKVLSLELKDLEMNQLITRTVKETQPITVEYALTEYGKTLKELTTVIAEWGLKHKKRIIGK